MKKEPMVYLGIRVPPDLREKLTKKAERLSKRAGVTVNVSDLARKILQEHFAS